MLCGCARGEVWGLCLLFEVASETPLMAATPWVMRRLGEPRMVLIALGVYCVSGDVIAPSPRHHHAPFTPHPHASSHTRAIAARV